MKAKTVSLIQLNIAVLAWGGTAMFAKGIQLPTGHIICIRSLIAAAVLLLFLIAARKPVRVLRPGHYGVMATLGLLLCLHWLTYFQALKVSTAAVAILAVQTYPVFTALLEPLLFKEKFRRVDIVMAVLVFAGVLIMTPEMHLSNSTTQGILLGIVSGLFFGARNLLTRKYVQEYPSSTLMFWQVLVTGIVLLPVLFFSHRVDYTLHTAGLLVTLAILFTAIPHTMFSASFKNLSARTVGIFATMLPFYGAVLGYLIHNETITVRTAIGGLIVFACILFETVRHLKKQGEHQCACQPSNP